MNVSKEIEKQIIQKINDLYIMSRNTYLVLNGKGEYYKKDFEKGHKKLNDGHIKSHLKGKQTIGVYAGEYLTKFLCFDVDVIDPNLAKWTTYKVIDSLVKLGIPENKIYISTSGNKGYHIDLYFNNAIPLHHSRELFDITLNHSELNDIDFGEVEFRPSHQGLKIPLGKNFRNKKSNNKCWYVDYTNGLKPIRSHKYILSIETIKTDIIFEILRKEKDIYINDESLNKEAASNLEETKEYINKQYKPLEAYKTNVDISSTIEHMEKLEREGLKRPGTRHNQLFTLSRYYKHLEFTKEENEFALIEWMNSQDIRTYSTSLKECYQDIKQIINYIYDKDISLTLNNKDIKVSYNEMLEIMNLKSKNDKLIMYCMLIHNKRYSEVGKVFYMSYNQMEQTSGLSLRTTKNIVPRIAESSILEIVEKNKSVYDNKKLFITKKPNKYKIIIHSNINNENIYNIDLMNEQSYYNTYNNCLLTLFDTNELKQLLTKNQYYELINSYSSGAII